MDGAGSIKKCHWCGRTFFSTGHSAEYCCTKCKNQAKYFQKHGHIKIGDRDRRPNTSLDDILKECKAKGLSYAEYQIQKTLSMGRTHEQVSES